MYLFLLLYYLINVKVYLDKLIIIKFFRDLKNKCILIFKLQILN